MADTSQIGRIPLELLEKIVEQLPVLDILRLKQVSHDFNGFIRDSYRIRHKLDLCETGLEPNVSAGFAIADSAKALKEYRLRWENVTIDKYQTIVRALSTGTKLTVGGVLGIPTGDEIQFIDLPSSFRAIEPKGYKIPFGSKVSGFAFNPQADVVVVAVPMGRVIKLRLITMSGGLPHPGALKATIESKTGPTSLSHSVSLSITGHRLASMVENTDTNTTQLNIWDWRTGKLLLERHSPYYQCFEFLDDYRLVVSVSRSEHGASLGLLVLDMEQVSFAVPTETFFHGPASCRHWACLFEAGGYSVPRDTLTAPFYSDPSQRIFSLSMEPHKGPCVMKVEALLGIAREQAGEQVQWEEWRPYLVETALPGALRTSHHLRSWVSGFRLFSVSIAQDDDGCDLHVYDFSPRARTKFLRLEEDGSQVMSPSVGGCRLPWDAIDIQDISFGHDSMVVQLYPIVPGNVPNGAPEIGNL